MTSFTLAHDLFDSVAVLGACCSSSVPIWAYVSGFCFFFTPAMVRHKTLQP